MLLVSASALFLGVGSGLLTTMGKDATLTGRTAVWDLVLSLTKNPMIGTGFESFWLGPRLDKIWSVYWWHPNEAHNGYIEVYLNLGWIGLSLLAVLMVTGYRTAISALRRDPESAGIRLAFFLVAVAYNFTESAVRIMHPVWIFFLLATITVPGGWARVRAQKPVALAPRTELAPCLEGV
jgi:O-antigen ligase